MDTTGGLRLTERKEGTAFTVRVIPRASRSELAGIKEGVLRVRLAAPPVGGAANAALVKLLAAILEVRERDVVILAGHNGRQKLLSVAGLSTGQVESRLRAG